MFVDIDLSFDRVTLTTLGLVAHLLLIVGFLVRERHRPTGTLAWLTVLVFAPLLGVVAYWLFGPLRVGKVRRRTLASARQVQEMVAGHELSTSAAVGAVPGLEPRTEILMRLGRRLSSTPATNHNDVTVLVDAAATYRAMINAIEQAEDHIHVLFYIFQPDSVGIALRDRLAHRAADGIEVRVLVDAVGSYSATTRFWEPLLDAGGEVGVFRPVRFTPLRSRDRNDLRNHRKIVVIDGKVGFTGGINIGREYLGLNPDIGHWRDTHMRISGPAALSLQQTFVEDWLSATGKLPRDPRYFPKPTIYPEGCTVQVIDSGPDQRWPSIARYTTQAVALAQHRVWITSPYFAPDPTMEDTLTTAALRGVDVRLLLPKKSDHRLLGFASRSYYRDLLEAGVKIHEYARGFMHAKTILIDEWVGTVGSANMDIRSFELNFELNAFVFSQRLVDALEEQFLADLEHAEAVTLAREAKVRLPARLGRSIARLMSPLL